MWNQVGDNAGRSTIAGLRGEFTLITAQCSVIQDINVEIDAKPLAKPIAAGFVPYEIIMRP